MMMQTQFGATHTQIYIYIYIYIVDLCLHKTIGRSISSDAEGSLVEWKGMHLIRCNQARKSGGLVGSGEDACCSWRRGRLLFFEGEDACCLWKRKLPRLGARGGGKWPGPAPVCVIHNEYIYIYIYIHYTSIFKSASNTYIYIYIHVRLLFV